MDPRTSSGRGLNLFRLFTRWKRAALSRLAFRFPGLLRLLPSARPMTVHLRPSTGATAARDLLVLLPGIDDHAEDFERWGFVDLVRRHEWHADLCLADAHYGYYADRTILEQLYRDIISPARESGYRSIWLAGISMGGLGALLCASRYEREVAGVIALAPFLGTQTIVTEIARAGGLTRWTSTISASPDEIRSLWSWLRRRERHPARGPEVFLAFGEEDTFVKAHRLLADALPPTHVVTTAGGHRWPVWQALWEEVLRRLQGRDPPNRTRECPGLGEDR